MKDIQYTAVGFSHLTGYAGIGGIAHSAADMTMVVTDIRSWVDASGNFSGVPIERVRRVKAHLGLHGAQLFMPPIAFLASPGMGGAKEPVGYTIPSHIFPSYMCCKKCQLLTFKPWYTAKSYEKKNLTCLSCGANQLEQTIWCAVSDEGDLQEVPWHHLCNHSSSQCREDKNSAYLKLSASRNGKPSISCTRCPNEPTTELREGYQVYLYPGKQPWLSNSYSEVTEKIEYAIYEINHPNVYIPKKADAIVIPPESQVEKDSVLYKVSSDSAFMSEINSNLPKLRRKSKIRAKANEMRCEYLEVEKAINLINAGVDTEDEIDFSENQYLDEYKALITPSEFPQNADFVTYHMTQAWKEFVSDKPKYRYLRELIKDVVAINRLRVIEVFTGFSRRASDEEDLPALPPDIVGNQDVYPAIELFGEGVFFTFNQEMLESWENQSLVQSKAQDIHDRYEISAIRSFDHLETPITARFILLHTIAHLIIRELETSAGYPAASLKERIYCSKPDGMAGILIYTAVSDIAGSLGGIVGKASPNEFLRLLSSAISHSEWCSLDPVCSSHEGQGPGRLNRAACHGCALIPEISCKYSNLFLDRKMVHVESEYGILAGSLRVTGTAGG